jgi:hypothetical protein
MPSIPAIVIAAATKCCIQESFLSSVEDGGSKGNRGVFRALPVHDGTSVKRKEFVKLVALLSPNEVARPSKPAAP